MRRQVVTIFLGVAILVAGCTSFPGKTASPPISAENPGYTSNDLALGEKAFRTHCAVCHGRNAEGNRGPDLTRGRFRHANDDETLYNIIQGGISGTGMPGAWMSASQTWQVVRYIRSLAGNQTIVEVPGDIELGRTLFAETADCATCHVVNGAGGNRGPDLSEIGWLRSPDHIRQSILSPSDLIEDNFKRVQISLKSGDQLDGILLNEDPYSIQLMDGEENLRAFTKSDVQEIVKPALSLMPEYTDALSIEQVDDLVAYLYSLKGTDEQ